MKILFKLFLCICFVHPALHAQVKLSENFESGDSLPAGWGVWNEAAFEIDPTTNWTVRDTGLALPGLATALSKAHSGQRAIGVSWWTSIDSGTGTGGTGDAWLITKKVHVSSGDALQFWGAGGSTSYLDSVQIWLNGTDSLPSTNEFLLATVIWPIGSVYGQFQPYTFDLSPAAGLDAWIGFRYSGDWSVDGFFVHLDDIYVGPPTSVNQIPNGIPAKSSLAQNYPNPFNPGTKIGFGVREMGFVSLKVYDLLGRDVATLVNEVKAPGTYDVQWNAGDQPSGVYMYRLTAGQIVETKKLLLMK